MNGREQKASRWDAILQWLAEREERGVTFKLRPFSHTLKSNLIWLLGALSLVALVAVILESLTAALIAVLILGGYIIVILWIASWGVVVELKSQKIRVGDIQGLLQYFEYKNVVRITRRPNGAVVMLYTDKGESSDSVEVPPETSTEFVRELSARYEEATGGPLEVIG